MRAAAIAFGIAMACAGLFVSDANAASCRTHYRDAKAAIGKSMAALSRLEHEASDRLKGLDTRPFDVLRDEARKEAAVVADERVLKDEEDLRKCRNLVLPVRKICADATAMLVGIVEKHVASPKPDYEKAQYSAAIGECERLLDIKPLKSLIRGND